MTMSEHHKYSFKKEITICSEYPPVCFEVFCAHCEQEIIDSEERVEIGQIHYDEYDVGFQECREHPPIATICIDCWSKMKEGFLTMLSLKS